MVVYLKKIINTKGKNNQSLVVKQCYKLSTEYMDKITILGKSHQIMSKNNFTFQEYGILNNLTNTEWCWFHNTYIIMEVYNIYPVQTKTGSSP